MASLSTVSQQKLATCHQDIQKVLQEAIKYFDFTVIYGHRSIEEQLDLYAIGRTKELSRGIVTNCDGVKIKSPHNFTPSRAIDIAPYSAALKGPDWQNIPAFHQLAGVVLTIAQQMNVKMTWGGTFERLRDYPHYELKQ